MRANKDNPERIELLYSRYGDSLFRMAYSILLNQADAEDAIQDVFSKILMKMPDFHDEEQERVWLMRVTMNQCKDQLRKKKLRIYTPIEEILNLAEEEAQDLGVLSIVLSLKEKYKEPLILYYFEGFSVEKTGEIIGIGKSAVKMRLSRGREMVKQRLEKEEAKVGRKIV